MADKQTPRMRQWNLKRYNKKAEENENAILAIITELTNQRNFLFKYCVNLRSRLGLDNGKSFMSL